MLISLGLDYTHADVRTRESFLLSDEEIGLAYDRSAQESQLVREFFSVNTCNRIELYGWAASLGGMDPHREMARRYFGRRDEAQRFLAASTHRVGRQAIEHLFRVTCGLESQVLGDIHIIGQLRTSYRLASEKGTVGTNLHRLLDTAIRCGKSVKKDTGLMTGRSSIGSEAAMVVSQGVDAIETARIVVVGSGKIGTHAAQSLMKQGARNVTIVNRTFSRGKILADAIGGTAADWSEFALCLANADAVIVATGAPEPVLGPRHLGGRRHDAGPVVIVDVSMPRNVDPAVRGCEGVRLVDLDTLHPQAANVARSRQAAIPEAEAVVHAHADEFQRWIAQQGAREALRPLRERLLEICLREIEYAVDAHNDAERAATRIVSKLMARPMSVLRDPEQHSDVDALTGAIKHLFSREQAELPEHRR